MREFIKKVIILMIVVGLVALVFNVKIKNISFEGNTKVDDIVIASAIFEKNTDRISAMLYLKDKFKKHKKIPLINSYNIEWLNPVSIVVHVNENMTVGFVRRDLSNLYFDNEGNINEISEKRQDGILEVTGIDFKNRGVGEKIEFTDKKLLNAILNISSFLKESDLPANLLEIRQGFEFYVYIGNIAVKMGDVRNMEVKLQRLLDIYPQIKDLNGTLDLSEAKENMLDEQYIFKKNN